MTFEQKIKELKEIIVNELTPLITNDYVWWGLPYHMNIGDSLIWQGEIDFLKTLPYKCKGICPGDALFESRESSRKVDIDKDTIILIHGGGFWGDIWRKNWENILNSIIHYPENPIIFLPQSIFYCNHSLLHKDMEILSQMKNLTMCVRDNNSYEIAKQYFIECGNIKLIPDMAFHISLTWLNRMKKKTTKETLYLKRLDKEAIGNSRFDYEPNFEIHDWPTLEPNFKNCFFNFHLKVIDYRSLFERRYPKISYYTSRLADYELFHFFRPDIIRLGVAFISRYKTIRTTRLHGLILSVLLGKRVISEDNLYGKLSSFYDTWLSDLDNVTIDRI